MGVFCGCLQDAPGATSNESLKAGIFASFCLATIRTLLQEVISMQKDQPDCRHQTLLDMILAQEVMSNQED